MSNQTKRGRTGRGYPKGRPVDPQARREVEAVLEGVPLRRDLLIEHLHGLQDRFGVLLPRHVVALADLLRLAPVEVFEVATFYAHFHIPGDDHALPHGPVVRVCDSLTCTLHGAEDLLAETTARVGGRARVERAPCMGLCDHAPAVHVGRRAVLQATTDSIEARVKSGRFRPHLPDAEDLATYRAGGGYTLLEACRTGEKSPEDVIAHLEAAGLRGLGGAGFPTGRKWRIVRGFPGPRLIAVNADEGEPGTFKDRYYLETAPHRMLEGALIAAWAVEAAAVYIYLRDEYPAVHALLRQEIAALDAAGLLGGVEVHLRRGAGAYICGEESAMLESIEGKRGLPRQRPPYVAEVGLFGRPTVVNNVETLHWVRAVLENPPEWYAVPRPRAYAVSGRVREPGVKIAPAGITVRALIEDHCGGMAEGHTFAAYLPGGASGGILPASLGDVPLDFGALEPHGGLIGSAAVIVLSDHDDVTAAARNLMHFFADESCGQCTPCRVGTEKAVTLLARTAWDRPLLDDLAEVMRDGSICGLGQAAPNVWTTVMRHFPEAGQ
ncbi:MAG: NADH-quinone oxidoreductase subunit F [Rhodospirillaceae bacterium BRH_c57]|nr:MAG: NADH-quinone oxidoreductase subunit F [Rhodospirillaceae bacterium BRH_c57]